MLAVCERDERATDADAPALAAGVVFVAPDGAVLLLCRSAQEANYGGHWALPGGKGEPGETPWMTACREAAEEIGAANRHAWIGEPTIVNETETSTGMVFTTFAQPVRYRFTPEIDAEHCGYVWAKAGMWPQPMHPAVAGVLGSLFPEGASDGFALDRATVRTKDADGHLRVEITPISKANVCPYYGREIPGWQALGLDAAKVYHLYRDPEELAKAAKTFAGKPLLLNHTPVSADGHPRQVTVGAVGDAVVFDPPYLKAPLTVWDGEAIDLVQTGEQRELSSAYSYRPDMTPGVGPDGQRYDGVMRDIVANHVALVEAGRAGPDVLVADSAPAGLSTIPNSGLPAGGSPRATAHHREKEPDMADKNAKDRARDEGLMERIKEKVTAEDFKALDELLHAGHAADEDKDDEKKAADEETDAEKRANESEGENLKDRERREKGADKAKDKAAKDEDDHADKAEDEEETMTKAEVSKAMDAAVGAAIRRERQNQNEIQEAREFVRPWVGNLPMAFDSAPDVYKAALEATGQAVAGIHPTAYRSILSYVPKPGAERRDNPRVALDAASAKSLADRFPEAARIGRA